MNLYKYNPSFRLQSYLIALIFLGIGLISTSEIKFTQSESVNTAHAQEVNETDVGLMDEVTCQCSSTLNPIGNQDCTANNWGTTCHTGSEFCSIGSSNCCGISGCDEPEEKED